MRRFKILLLAAAAPLLANSSCQNNQPAAATPQGWTWDEQDAWYVADQGSRLIPQKWIDALEQPDGGAVGNGKFVASTYLAQFNYLPPALFARKDADPSCPFDPNLPIGFVTTCQDASKFGVTNLSWLSKPHPAEPWVGMNCSACHTNAMELHYTDGKPGPTETLLVDGAPTLADFQGFMAALEKSLEQTYQDDQKFGRFAAAILPSDEADADKPKLKQAMGRLIAWNKYLAVVNADEDSHYGYGRLDAIGHIFNKVAVTALPDPGQGQFSNPSDAPVSYPFLWNVPQLNKVEWNGIAPNLPITILGTEDPGALIRNTGEVTGVFADLTIAPHVGGKGYVSSARIDRLDEMEQQLRKLHAPAWPTRFGLNQTTDPTSASYARSVDRGKGLFAAQCAACHTVPKAFGDTTERFMVTLTPLANVGTDMWMACSASFDQAKAGAFAGEKQNLVVGDPLPDPASNLSLLQAAAVGTLLGQKQELIDSVLKGLLGLDNGLPQPPRRIGLVSVVGRDVRANQCEGAMTHKSDPQYAQLAYKGRPLQGIWATAPYLHNGSVPSLYTLLLPPEKRPTKFWVGSHVFDPTEVGFEYKAPGPNTSEFDVVPSTGSAVCHDSNGRGVVCGNSNWGHDYNNAALTDDDRYALIEFMKTL